jgi:uncharacterized membrane protein
MAVMTAAERKGRARWHERKHLLSSDFASRSGVRGVFLILSSMGWRVLAFVFVCSTRKRGRKRGEEEAVGVWGCR